MAEKSLNPDVAWRLLELGEKPYRPPQILKLRDEIEAETRAAELMAPFLNDLELEARVKKIVGMKLELDHLYCQWAKGEIK